ncbi:uncharacterized protein PHALS_15354 [Plasmopara halstedii]|uniref:Uncharacterized protein n=1 Tax=Plasmopara halstedii TaxID=4781 RepID=A0A0P1AE46_PLAHL|nr:uncharacterized protein PHALS_15354 [Plasmopara halstedii]CEG39095.1 hypothetical protein PHALS_15354 [Plasmopara halstedii]|eukprot:XP_024575464.1 hypothetical protein PHALS_15354 [Plasmopara halstedii]
MMLYHRHATNRLDLPIVTPIILSLCSTLFITCILACTPWKSDFGRHLKEFATLDYCRKVCFK